MQPSPSSGIPTPTGQTSPAGPTGLLDRLIRRFGRVAHLLAVLLVYAIVVAVIALALAPALILLARWLPWALTFEGWTRWPLAGAGFGLAFLIAGFALLVVVPVFNLILPTRVRSYRGAYYSIAAVPWFLHNALFYLARYTFLPYVTLTPFGPLFLAAMGMRLGRRVFINTELISDPQLITLGDDVVIGGSVTLFAHWGGGGHLAIEPVIIEAGATIGEKATVMGDVRVGPGAVVLPHSVLLPGARVGAGETWGGVPARRLGPEEMLAMGLHAHSRGASQADPLRR
jgi:acetyltransferase-like isoleucine patch superfamily enzyme